MQGQANPNSCKKASLDRIIMRPAPAGHFPSFPVVQTFLSVSISSSDSQTWLWLKNANKSVCITQAATSVRWK